MGRAPCCSKVGLRRGPWDTREDTLLLNYIQAHGEGHWRSLPKKAGLLRCGKSCRLRWLNYLKPDIKRGNITPHEDDLIIRLHSLLGNRWSLIAGRLPGRTDNEIKNYWNTHLSKRFKNQETDPNTHKKLSEPLVTQQVMSKSDINKKRKSSFSDQNPKVHLPKPIRATKTSFPLPRNESFKSDPLLEYANYGENVSSFLVDDHDFVNGSDFECLSHEDDSSSLEKLYEEYLKILKTSDDEGVQFDSFDESVLISGEEM